MRYALPNMEETSLQAKNDQLSVLNHTKLVEVLAPLGRLILTKRTSILQYNVECDGKCRNQNGFISFRMEIASDYVKTNLKLAMKDHEFVECIKYLHLMLISKTQQLVIYANHIFSNDKLLKMASGMITSRV